MEKGASKESSRGWTILSTEDYWAIWLGMIVIMLSVGFFCAGSSLKPWAVTPGTWSDLGTGMPIVCVHDLEMNARTRIPRGRRTRLRTEWGCRCYPSHRRT